MWEHSYYIDYRNARPKYLEAWFDNLVNWEHVGELLRRSQSRAVSAQPNAPDPPVQPAGFFCWLLHAAPLSLTARAPC